jgi:hypothetical protein
MMNCVETERVIVFKCWVLVLMLLEATWMLIAGASLFVRRGTSRPLYEDK